jgi:hypothetical protein
LEWILLYYVKSDRINRIIRIFFLFSSISGHRPIGPMARREEIDETQSTLGGKKNFIQLFLYLISAPKSCGCLMPILICLAAGDCVFFISSGNKE